MVHEYSATHVTSVQFSEYKYTINMILGFKKKATSPPFRFSFCNTSSLSHGKQLNVATIRKRIFLYLLLTHSYIRVMMHG